MEKKLEEKTKNKNSNKIKIALIRKKTEQEPIFFG